jgi:hypothetical protein
LDVVDTDATQQVDLSLLEPRNLPILIGDGGNIIQDDAQHTLPRNVQPLSFDISANVTGRHFSSA